LIIAEASQAQGAGNNAEKRMPVAAKATPGTYRLLVNPGGEQEFFPEEVLVMAEQLRRDHETIRYPLSSFVTIEIFSRDELRNRNVDSARLSEDKPVDHEK
jgi:hypothetical protein